MAGTRPALIHPTEASILTCSMQSGDGQGRDPSWFFGGGSGQCRRPCSSHRWGVIVRARRIGEGHWALLLMPACFAVPASPSCCCRLFHLPGPFFHLVLHPPRARSLPTRAGTRSHPRRGPGAASAQHSARHSARQGFSSGPRGFCTPPGQTRDAGGRRVKYSKACEPFERSGGEGFIEN